MNKSRTILVQSLIALLPVIYLLAIWNNLPESVPLHYNQDFEADKYGSKISMLTILLMMVVITLGTSLLIQNLERLDPKKRAGANSVLMVRISWVIVFFITLISCLIVFVTERYSQGVTERVSPKYIVAAVAVLFAVMGNYMNNIKPNYFVGIRTPWALEDEENWRLTHHLSARIWFFVGLLLFFLVLLLPEKYTSFVLLFCLLPLVAVPYLYSYYLFRQKRRRS